MSDITIKHDHENGTRLEGSAKGDGVYELLRPLGWTYRSWAGVHIRGSRDRFAYPSDLERYAKVLREAGHSVTVEVDNTWRPAAVRWAEREERADDRADRYEERAGKAAARSTTARDQRRQISDGIPFGQPKMPGHHSYARACRDENRMEALDRRSYAEADYAEHLASRAEGARSNEAAKHNPRAIMRKIETLETDIRRAERDLAGSTSPDGGSTTITRLRVERDREEVTYLRGLLGQHADAGTFVAWSPDNIAKGDAVRVGSFGWYKVTRVNRKTVSLDSQSWPRTATWDDIRGRRRGGEQIDTPNGEPWPVELARKVHRWAELTHRAKGYPHDDEARRHHEQMAWAPRLVHGLDLGAGDAELAAAARLDERDVAGQRDLAARYLAVYDQLAAGVPVADITAALTPDQATPAWQLPTDREPEDRRTGPLSGWRGDDGRQVQPGDLVKGFYDRGFTGRTLIRSFCGPVAAVSEVNHRREAGDWVTITLADGTEREFQTHIWLAVYPAGTWENDTLTEPPQEEPPQCPNWHGAMVRRENPTPEAAGQGTWWDCVPGPVGRTCLSSVLVPSEQLTAQLTEQRDRAEAGQ